MSGNPRQGKIMKAIWFKSEREFQKLKDACEGNYPEEAGNLIQEVMLREENK
jgi:hypothetical protein